MSRTKNNQQENQLQVTTDGFKSRYPLSSLRPGVHTTVQTTVCHVHLRRSPDGYQRTVHDSMLRYASRIIVTKQGSIE